MIKCRVLSRRVKRRRRRCDEYIGICGMDGWLVGGGMVSQLVSQLVIHYDIDIDIDIN